MIGFKKIKVLLILRGALFFDMLHPLMACGHGVEPPVNEHAETTVDKLRSVTTKVMVIHQ